MNKSYTSVLTKIVKLLDTHGVNFKTEDSMDGSPWYLEIEGREIVINDDYEREQLYTNLEFEQPLKEFEEIFTSEFGAPEKKYPHGVLNWTVKKNLIVLSGDGVEVIRNYTKR